MKYKTYYCVWQILKADVDQYGLRESNVQVLETCNSHEEAERRLPVYAVKRLPNAPYSSWKPLKPEHDYQEVYIAYREILKEEWEV